jgi:hypothetical protein
LKRPDDRQDHDRKYRDGDDAKKPLVIFHPPISISDATLRCKGRVLSFFPPQAAHILTIHCHCC